MVNLIAGEQVVPELVQQNFTASNVVAQVRDILPDGAARTRMVEGLARVKAKLRAPESAIEGPVQHPADRAATIIWSIGNSIRSHS
jgi:lipid-A-disaccharide synthase